MLLICTQCFPPDLGGVEIMVAGLADAAHASGRAVTVFADGEDDPSAMGGGDADRPYPVKRFAGFKPLRRRRKAWAAGRAAAGAELILCDSWKSLEHLPAPGRSGPRIHCLAHGMELPPAPSAAKARRIRAAYAKADKILANSSFTAGLVAPYLAGAQAQTRLSVATPPIEPQPEASPEDLAELARLIGPADPLIAFVGRLEPRKGVDRVIEALAGFGEAHPGAVFAVAGAGPDRARLEALAAGAQARSRVRFLGRISDALKAALLRRADLFAMPTRREGASVEGFGIVYLEAGWRETPALAGRGSGAEDAVIDGQTGVLCDGADLGSVSAALRALLDDPDARRRMGGAAADRARSQVWSARLADFL